MTIFIVMMAVIGVICTIIGAYGKIMGKNQNEERIRMIIREELERSMPSQTQR